MIRLFRIATPRRQFSSYIQPIIASPVDIAKGNPALARALEMFNSNDLRGALEIALDEYKREFESADESELMKSPRNNSESSRPAFSFLSSLLASLGPRHPETLLTLSKMQSIGEEATPFLPRAIRKRHGGYPVRLNNGKWTWQGPHWSLNNNRTWKTGYSSDFTYGWSK